MQNQVISNNLRGRSSSRQRGKKKFEPLKKDEQNIGKIMIVKSLSIEHNASLITNPFYCKRSKSSLNQFRMSKENLSKHIKGIKNGINNESGQSLKSQIDLKGQVQCIQHCREFNKQKKIDFLWKIKDIERRISKDFRNTKIKENRRYISESKDNKTIMIPNRSVEISSLIKIKPIQNTQQAVHLGVNKFHKKITFDDIKFSKYFKHKKAPLTGHKKNITFFNSTIKHRSFCIQQLSSQSQGFEGWKTFSDYDF